jgi:hypothetical protein
VEVTFALQDSNLPLQAGFPAFLSNALNWMTGEPPALQARLGVVEIPLAAAQVLDVQGKKVSARALADSTLVEAHQPGFFTAFANDARVRVAVNLLNPALTRINDSRLATQSAAPRASPGSGIPFNPWMLLLLVAALLLVAEWWTYNRRLTV